jgi:hypothetical protein
MRMQIDEAGRHCESGRVDLALAGRASGVAGIDQRGNLAIFERDIGAKARRSTAIDDDGIANNYVIFHARDYSRVSASSANPSGQDFDQCRSISILVALSRCERSSTRAIERSVFDHDLIEKHAFENIPLDRDLYLMDEQWMPAYEQSLLSLFSGGKREQVGYISSAAARAISANAIDLSWYPNIFDRFHEIRVILPRSEFVVCTECWQRDEKPRIFVRSGWLTNLHLRAYSVFALIDAIGVKEALANGTLTRPKLIALRDKIDEIATRYPAIAFISFADSLLLKSNWFVGQWDSAIHYTYEPEAIIRLLPEIDSAYRDTLGMNIYAVITQGNNEYYDDDLLHISPARNHVSLNSLGLPFAQLMAIDSAARKNIRDGVHPRREVYMDQNFFRSLRLDLKFDKGNRSKYFYEAPMARGSSYYFLGTCQTLLDSFRLAEDETSALRERPK